MTATTAATAAGQWHRRRSLRQTGGRRRRRDRALRRGPLRDGRPGTLQRNERVLSSLHLRRRNASLLRRRRAIWPGLLRLCPPSRSSAASSFYAQRLGISAKANKLYSREYNYCSRRKHRPPSLLSSAPNDRFYFSLYVSLSLFLLSFSNGRGGG